MVHMQIYPHTYVLKLSNVWPYFMNFMSFPSFIRLPFQFQIWNALKLCVNTQGIIEEKVFYVFCFSLGLNYICIADIFSVL